MLAELIARRFTFVRRGPIQQRATPLESTAIAQVEMEDYELARAGRLFYGGTQLAANGIAPDATLPTTTVKCALYNRTDSVNTLSIRHLHHFLISGTPAAGLTMWVCVSNGRIATPVAANVTGFGTGSSSGLGQSLTYWGTAVTFPTGTIWHSLGSNFQLAAANIGQGDQPYNVYGGLLVPPGYALGFALFSAAGTTPLYGISARWGELEADLEN